MRLCSMLTVALPIRLTRYGSVHAPHTGTHTLTIDSALTDEYYKTEWIYSFLSAGAKLTLGLLLYVSVSCHVSMSVRDMN